MANNEEDYGLSKVQQVVLVAADPHIDDLVVSEPHDVKDSNILQAKVFQMPIKLADEGDKVETKMAALIMVEREDLPLDAQNIIKEEIKEVKASGSDVVPVVPQQFTSKNTIALPPFDPYYYVGKLPSNFANSLTTNVSTNSLSMQRVSVDSTKLVDMLNMAKLSTQISSLNDSIHSFVVTSEPSQSSATSFRGISSSGVYSSSPYRSSDGKPAANDSSQESDFASDTPVDFPATSFGEYASGILTENCFVGEMENIQLTDLLTSETGVIGIHDDCGNLEIGIAKETDKKIKENLNDIVLEDIEDNEVFAYHSTSQLDINNLPQEILQRIFSYFTQYELVKTCALVCKFWWEIAHDPIYWQSLKFSSEITLCAFKQVVSRCSLLKSLELCGFDEFPEDGISTIASSCPMLISLDLSFCDAVNFQTTQHICNAMPQLEKLNVEGCQQVDGLCVHNLSRLTNLTDLNLSHCSRVNSISICVLAKALKKLQHLNIDGIPQVKDEAISTLVSHQNENLLSLHLDGAELTDHALFYLLKCKNLRRLLLSFAELLTDKALLYIKEMTWLQELQLRKGDGFTNKALYWLFDCKSLCQLTILNLSECTAVMDNTVIAIVESCGKSLRYLSLCWCYHIGDVGVESIVENCRNMEILDLLGLDQVYGYSFCRIPETMPRLVYLNLQQCHKVVDSLILTVVRQMPQLVAINYYGEEFRHGSLPL